MPPNRFPTVVRIDAPIEGGACDLADGGMLVFDPSVTAQADNNRRGRKTYRLQLGVAAPGMCLPVRDRIGRDAGT